MRARRGRTTPATAHHSGDDPQAAVSTEGGARPWSLAEIREREEREALEQRVRAAEDRARHAEIRLLEMREALTRASREAAGRTPQLPLTAPTPRADRVAAARDHELARMRAKLLDGETAGANLAERLWFAHRQAGKAPLEKLGQEVGYSKATLSKVLNGKMLPTWALVRKLGLCFQVPQAHIMQEWLPLWIAADAYRHSSPATARGQSGGPAESSSAALTTPTGHTCPKCGTWVVDVAQHAGWHMANETGGLAPAAESIGPGWNGESQELSLLKEALGGGGD